MNKTSHQAYMLPAPPGTCEACAINHPADQPHNQQSLHWQYWFYGKNGRWPKWGDAMAHCTEDVQNFWKAELIKRGQKI